MTIGEDTMTIGALTMTREEAETLRDWLRSHPPTTLLLMLGYGVLIRQLEGGVSKLKPADLARCGNALAQALATARAAKDKG